MSISCSACGVENMSDIELSSDGRLRCILCRAPFDILTPEDAPTPLMPIHAIQRILEESADAIPVAKVAISCEENDDWLAMTDDPLRMLPPLLDDPLPAFEIAETEAQGDRADWAESSHAEFDLRRRIEEEIDAADVIEDDDLFVEPILSTPMVWVAALGIGVTDTALDRPMNLRRSSMHAAAQGQPAELAAPAVVPVSIASLQ